MKIFEKTKLNIFKPDGWIKPFGKTNSLFIHIPKTAGTSIALCCYEEDPWHFPITHYSYLSSELFDSLFKYAFVRNPYFRLISSYQYAFKQIIVNPKTSVSFVCEFESFADFVKKWVNKENVQKHYFFYPQHMYVCDKEKNQLVDYIGKFENLKHDFQYVANKLDIKKELMKSNESNLESRPVFTKDLAEIVFEAYETDFMLFNYEKTSYLTDKLPNDNQ